MFVEGVNSVKTLLVFRAGGFVFFSFLFKMKATKLKATKKSLRATGGGTVYSCYKNLDPQH